MSINDNAVGAPYILRSHRPGDIGHIVARHGKIYDSEYGWDVRFEALVARLVADIITNFDPHRERFWIAENQRNGEFLGCIAVAQDPCDKKVALLRLLLVEETARGMGLGARLIKECISFAMAQGYSSITLKTYSVLEGARRLYARAGFRLVETSVGKEEYGKMLVRETWELVIAGDSECREAS